MRVHVETLFTRDGADRLRQENALGHGAAPRFFLGRTIHANDCWFRNDLSDELIADLRSLCHAERVGDVNTSHDQAMPFMARLSLELPVSAIYTGPAFCFAESSITTHHAIAVTGENIGVLSPYLDPWREDVTAGMPMAAVLDHGRAVSVCCSVRVGQEAHEAGVETHPDFRGRGHAAAAVRAWAAMVRELGLMPLYSTSWDNTASRALARSLGLVQYGAALHLT